MFIYLFIYIYVYIYLFIYLYLFIYIIYKYIYLFIYLYRKLLCVRPLTHLSQGNGKSKSLMLLTPYISLKVRPSTAVAQVPITAALPVPIFLCFISLHSEQGQLNAINHLFIDSCKSFNLMILCSCFPPWTTRTAWPLGEVLALRQDVHPKPCDRHANSDQLNSAPVEIWDSWQFGCKYPKCHLRQQHKG